MKIRWRNVSIVLFVLALLFWHPLTRPIIWFLLPLGRSPDDLMFWAFLLAFVATLIATIRGWVFLPSLLDNLLSIFVKHNRKRKNEDIYEDNWFHEEDPN